MHQQPAMAAETSVSSSQLRYVHTTTDAERRRLERRTVATSAGFLVPYLRPGMRLLDCGCGPGSITVGLAEVVAPGETIGLDLQVVQCDRARALAAGRGLSNARFEVGSVYAIPFADASLDVVFAHNLIVHVAEPLRAMLEMRRVLKPGGLVAIADDDMGSWLWEPATPLLREAERVFRLAVGHHGGDPFRPRHHRRLLRQAGFARPIAGASLGTIGVYGTDEATRDFALWFVEQISAPEFVQLAAAQGWADGQQMEQLAAAVLEWGRDQDAFLVGTGVTALGWVESVDAPS